MNANDLLYAVDELRIKTNNDMDRIKELENILQLYVEATETAHVQEGIWFNQVYKQAKTILANSSNDIQNVRDLLLDFGVYYEDDKTSTAVDEVVDNYLDQKQ